MTHKIKRKSQPKSPFQRFWQEFLFTKPFYYETDRPRDEVVYHLRELGHQSGGVLMPWQYDLDYRQPSKHNDTFTFQLKMKRRGKHHYQAVSEVNGSLQDDPATGITILQREAKFAWWNYLILFLMAGSFFLCTSLSTIGNPSLPTFWFIPYLAIILWAWWLTYQDRNRLINELKAITETSKVKRE